MLDISVKSARQASEFNPRSRTTLIRILDFHKPTRLQRPYPPLLYESRFAKILSYSFDDLTPRPFQDGSIPANKKHQYKLFSESDAAKIIMDFSKIKDISDYLIVHCYLGRSRSPAVAAALNHMFSLGIDDSSFMDEDTRANMHVYSTMVQVAREKMSLDFKSPWFGER